MEIAGIWELSQSAGDKLMTTCAEHWKREGMERGIVQGMEKGDSSRHGKGDSSRHGKGDSSRHG